MESFVGVPYSLPRSEAAGNPARQGHSQSSADSLHVVVLNESVHFFGDPVIQGVKFFNERREMVDIIDVFDCITHSQSQSGIEAEPC